MFIFVPSKNILYKGLNIFDNKHSSSNESFPSHVPAQSGSVTHRRGRGRCRVAPVRLGAEGPQGLEELAEVGWEQCWASSVP